MGFGILLIGYFLLLNFAYCDFSDAVAAVLILYALFKLARINRNFKISAYVAIPFTVLGVAELCIAAYDMMFPISASSPIFTTVALIRHLVLAFLSFTMLLGIRDVADEVKLPALSSKSVRCAILTVAIYALNIILESISLGNLVGVGILPYVYFFAIIATRAMTVINLTVIYTAYMRICMPGDEDMSEKKSRFGFVNAFRAHEEEKSREYAEYKLNRLKEKQRKKEEKRK